MSWFRRWRLRARLLALVALVTIPALAGIGYGGFVQRRQAAEEVRRDALIQARGAAADEERLVTETRQFLALLSTLPQIRGEPAECSAFLADVLARSELYANIGVVDRDGLVRCSAVPIRAPVDASSRSWFRRAVETGEFAVGDYQVGMITGIPSVNFGFPILDDADRVAAVMFVALPLTWLQERLAAAELPPGSEVLIVGPALRVLARFPPAGDWVGRNIADTPLGGVLRAGPTETTVHVQGLDGLRRLYATAPLRATAADQAVTLSVGVPLATAYAPADRAIVRNLVLLAGLLVLIIGGTWVSSGALVLRPVNALLLATRRLHAGDLSARAPHVESRNEVDELAGSFNEMARTLEARASESREHLLRIQRLNRVYAVLSGINGLILRVRERDELLRSVCRLAVEKGGFALAWIGEVGTEAGEVRTLAQAAAPLDLAESRAALAAIDFAALAALVAPDLREGREAVSNDLAADLRVTPWVEPLARLGIRSAAAFPLVVEGRNVGVLQLYARERDFFNEEELRLLGELAGDTSLGLEYIEKENRLHYLANYDPLTDLPNQALFTDRVEQAIASAHGHDRLTAVLVLGIDRFRELNATLGHHVTDQGLKLMAGRLREAVPEGDTVARLGSGEFAIALTRVSRLADIEMAAGKILSLAPITFGHAGEQVRLSFRIGIAVSPQDGTAAAGLIKAATLALQTATASSDLPIAFYSAELNAHAQERRVLEHELRRAAERGELTLWYQPVVRLADRGVTGVEALLRWSNPRLGEVPPSAFIPVAEASGQILQLGEWILATATAQGRRWRDEGLEIRVNVNVSVQQLRHPDFTDRALAILGGAAGEPPPVGLGIEITESELMENVIRAAGAIGRFKEIGLRVYIDDFGTGYSSLSYLRTLEVDALKIDRSFVSDIPDSPDAIAVVRGIIALAHSLGLEVIAEGIETEEQLATLRDLGCDAGQGYLFSRAVLAEEVAALVRRP